MFNANRVFPYHVVHFGGELVLGSLQVKYGCLFFVRYTRKHQKSHLEWFNDVPVTKHRVAAVFSCLRGSPNQIWADSVWSGFLRNQETWLKFGQKFYNFRNFQISVFYEVVWHEVVDRLKTVSARWVTAFHVLGEDSSCELRVNPVCVKRFQHTLNLIKL